jgi:hypothetical protein
MKIGVVAGNRDVSGRKRVRWKRKFLYYFPGGFASQKYIDWERGYKWNAHLAWKEKLNEKEFARLLKQKEYLEIVKRAVGLESKTNLLFSFEKMALRDAVKTKEDARSFSEGLYDYVYSNRPIKERFEKFRDMLSMLPVKQTRVVTWPLLTVFGFIAEPREHIFLKPVVTRAAASKYGFEFKYSSKPNWETYQSLLEFAATIKNDTKELRPKDMIDIQSFIWVMGSEEYPD